MAYTYANTNRVYIGVQTILNKQQLGFASVSQYNIVSRIAQDTIFDKKIDALNSQVRNKIRNIDTVNRSLEQRAEEDLAPLFVYDEVQAVSSGTNIFDFPSNCAYIKEISYNGNVVDIITPSKAKYYTNSYYTPPTDEYCIAVMGSNQIEVIGDALSSDLTMSYYRRPRGSVSGAASSGYPTWGYVTVGENQNYNSAASIDFELPSHLEQELIYEIASIMGANLRDVEMIQYAEKKIADDEQTETSMR